ncbi:hypothetical protein BH10PSE1_BH10PSE1_21530 [soil metagenome]
METGILLGFNALGFVALLRWGDWAERIAVAVIVVYIAISPFSALLLAGPWRLGTALSDAALLFALIVLTDRWGRWWLVLAAAAQVGVVVTHIVPLLVSGDPARASYTLRMIFWLVISLTFFIGAWEAWADRKYRLEETHHGESHNQTRRLRDAG